MENNKLGHVSTLKLQITAPIPMDHDMDIRALVLMTGKNGTGKTVILKLNWIICAMAYIAVVGNLEDPALSEVAQFYIDNTFDDHDIDGIIGGTFESGASLEITCKEGKVLTSVMIKDPSVTIASHPIYMSSETRLISESVRYMRYCKSCSILFKVAENEENLKSVLHLYKLYDALFMESLLIRLNAGFTLTQITELQTRLDTFEQDLTIKGIKISDKQDDILYTADGEKWSSVRLLGAGHQALLTMTLGGMTI